MVVVLVVVVDSIKRNPFLSHSPRIPSSWK
jgi:hypothetical protein